MSDCLFCRLVAGDIPAKIVFKDEHLVAFQDINPQAPMHVLIVPRRHVATLNDLSDADDALVGEMVRRAASIAARAGLRTSEATGPCSTATPTQVRRSSTSTCMCWEGGR